MAGAASLAAALEARLPPFQPLWPWIGGDLQTMRNWLTKPRPPIGDWPAEPLTFAMDDGTGDALHGVIQQPHEATARPLVILIHGLTGSVESSYMRVSAVHLLRAGYPVLRLNLRGAGPGAGRSKSFYHAGRSDDLRRVVASLDARFTANGIAVVGFSLGANLVLKYLAEEGAQAPVLAGAAISPPIDLHAAQLCLAGRRNRLYHRHLLEEMKRERGADLPPGIRTILDFDDRVVAPAHGFKDARDYYRQSSAGPMLGAIRRPTLIIHADDDPWIPAVGFQAIDWAANPALVPLIPRSGGHVGFHARGLAMPWHDAALQAFLSDLR